MKIKQEVIGTFYAWHLQIQLVLMEGSGGEFYRCPEDGALPRIKVGADYDTWNEVVAVLIHELDELILDYMGCRFNPTNLLYPKDHGAYTFLYTHLQHSNKCAQSADFLVSALPPFSTAWKKWKKKHPKTSA